MDVPTFKSDQDKIPLLILAGPTAVGKSALALILAEKLGTEIISADSAQVYRFMDIGTAKPTCSEQKQVRHHLIDLVNPDQPFSAADFQKAAAASVKDIWHRNKLPFIVGGTGLYIKALIESYAFGKRGADPDLRSELNKRADNEGVEVLYEQLKDIDPRAAEKINPNDQRRIIRALEVFLVEGKPISDQVRNTVESSSPYLCHFFALNMQREMLYERINTRVDQMMKAGFLNEVKMILDKGYRNSDPGLQILGYRQLCSYLESKLSLKDAVNNTKKLTRNLAKRQMTWFRHQFTINWIDISPDTDLQEVSEKIYSAVKDLRPGRANIRANDTKGAR